MTRTTIDELFLPMGIVFIVGLIYAILGLPIDHQENIPLKVSASVNGQTTYVTPKGEHYTIEDKDWLGQSNVDLTIKTPTKTHPNGSKTATGTVSRLGLDDIQETIYRK